MILSGCITSAKYNMSAIVLPQGTYTPSETDPETGHWEITVDPVSGQITRVWVGGDTVGTPGGAWEIACQANAIITGGLNSQGTTERWTTKGAYDNVDFVELRVAPGTIIRRRDRVTDIKGPDGEVLWLEEDHPDEDGSIPSTVFQVRGVAPSLDIFNRPIEYFVLLERAENQELSPSG